MSLYSLVSCIFYPFNARLNFFLPLDTVLKIPFSINLTLSSVLLKLHENIVPVVMLSKFNSLGKPQVKSLLCHPNKDASNNSGWILRFHYMNPTPSVSEGRARSCKYKSFEIRKNLHNKCPEAAVTSLLLLF